MDSSKTASWVGGRPFALKFVAGCSVYFIHLVRRPESVVGSLLKGSNKDLEKGFRDVRHYRVIKGLLGWVQANIVALAMRRLLGRERYILLRYEDLIREPEATFARLAGFLGVNDEPWQDVVSGKPVERAWHIFSGNRLRHINVKLVTQVSQAEIPLSYRFICSVLCWPLKSRFGY